MMLGLHHPFPLLKINSSEGAHACADVAVYMNTYSVCVFITMFYATTSKK
jgi:hypothetical protein